MDAFCARLERDARQVTAAITLTGVVFQDPADDAIVACAVEAGADFLVTGDGALLSLGSYGLVQIVTPRQFLDILHRGRELDTGTASS